MCNGCSAKVVVADKENLKRKTNVETDLIEDDATLDGNVAPKAKSKKLNL